MVPFFFYHGYMQHKYTLPTVIVIAGIMIGLGFYFTSAKQGEIVRDTTKPVEITEPRPITSDDYIRGNPNAPVVLIEYSDTECPFCKVFHATMRSYMEDNAATGNIAWVYRHLPIEALHSKAVMEAHAAECVAEKSGKKAFWEFIDSLFTLTPSNNQLEASALEELAIAHGLTESEYALCQNSKRHVSKIQKDVDDAIHAGAEATPFLIFVTAKGDIFPVTEGALPYEVLDSVVNIIVEGVETNTPRQIIQNQINSIF